VGPRNFALLAHRYADGEIPPVPLRAFDIPARWDALWFSHRLRIRSPNSKGEVIMSEQTNKPAAKINLYPVSSTIWRNQNAKGAFFYTAQFERSYRDEAGKWQTSSTFNAQDLLLLAKAANEAESEIRRLRAADRTSDQSEDEAA
jgi:hypothetical protein